MTDRRTLLLRARRRGLRFTAAPPPTDPGVRAAGVVTARGNSAAATATEFGNPDAGMRSLLVGWVDLQPTEAAAASGGTWATLDASVAAAHDDGWQLLLRVLCGIEHTPPWVFTHPTAPVPWVSAASSTGPWPVQVGAAPGASSYPVPLPWQPNPPASPTDEQVRTSVDGSPLRSHYQGFLGKLGGWLNGPCPRDPSHTRATHVPVVPCALPTAYGSEMTTSDGNPVNGVPTYGRSAVEGNTSSITGANSAGTAPTQVAYHQAWRRCLEDHLAYLPSQVAASVAGGHLFGDGSKAALDLLNTHGVAAGQRCVWIRTDFRQTYFSTFGGGLGTPTSPIEFLKRAHDLGVAYGIQTAGNTLLFDGGGPETTETFVGMVETLLTHLPAPRFFETSVSLARPPSTTATGSFFAGGASSTTAQGGWPGGTANAAHYLTTGTGNVQDRLGPPAPTVNTTSIPNPERGYFTYTETHYQTNNTGHTALNSSTLTTARTTDHRTVVFRYFVMEKYRTVDTIDQAYLDLVAADLQAVRDAGCKAILRFVYSTSGDMTPPYDGDTTPTRTLGHVTQLAPTINAHADVVHAVQAGLIGMWGEWYYTDFWGDQGTLTQTDWNNRKALLDSLLDNLDPSIFLLLRYVGTIHRYLSETTPTATRYAARIGHHNDALGAPFADYGTYTTFTALNEADTRAYLATHTATHSVPVVGESAVADGTNTAFPAIRAQLEANKWSSLNPLYHPDVFAQWSTAEEAEAGRNLGYRLRLMSSSVTPAAGNTIDVTLNITNDGYAAPTTTRPVRVVFVGPTTVTADIPGVDTRDWTNGPITVTGNVPIPTPAGTYTVHLLLPDPAPALQATPAYSIRLLDAAWDPATGRHDLSATVTSAGALYDGWDHTSNTAPPRRTARAYHDNAGLYLADDRDNLTTVGQAGNYVTTGDNQVIDRVDALDDIVVQHSNVTIKRSRLRKGIDVGGLPPGATPPKVIYCDMIHNNGVASTAVKNAVSGNVHMYRCNVSGYVDIFAVKTANDDTGHTTIAIDNFIHDLRLVDDPGQPGRSHNDIYQSNQDNTVAELRHNTIFGSASNNFSAVEGWTRDSGPHWTTGATPYQCTFDNPASGGDNVGRINAGACMLKAGIGATFICEGNLVLGSMFRITNATQGNTCDAIDNEIAPEHMDGGNNPWGGQLRTISGNVHYLTGNPAN